MTLIEELRNKKSRDNRELLDRAADRIEELEKHLPFVLTNEENVSAKVKQIEEMAYVIKSSLDDLGQGDFKFTGYEISKMFAKALYNAGYRKQNEDMESEDKG